MKGYFYNGLKVGILKKLLNRKSAKVLRLMIFFKEREKLAMSSL